MFNVLLLSIKKLLKNLEGEYVGQLLLFSFSFFSPEMISTMWSFLFWTFSFENFYSEGRSCGSYLLYHLYLLLKKLSNRQVIEQLRS